MICVMLKLIDFIDIWAQFIIEYYILRDNYYKKNLHSFYTRIS